MSLHIWKHLQSDHLPSMLPKMPRHSLTVCRSVNLQFPDSPSIANTSTVFVKENLRLPKSLSTSVELKRLHPCQVSKPAASLANHMVLLMIPRGAHLPLICSFWHSKPMILTELLSTSDLITGMHGHLVYQ